MNIFFLISHLAQFENGKKMSIQSLLHFILFTFLGLKGPFTVNDLRFRSTKANIINYSHFTYEVSKFIKKTNNCQENTLRLENKKYEDI